MTTSPDTSQYVDLTLFDADPTDLVAAAVANHQLQFPDWIPAEGTAEMTLIEDVAVVISQLMFAADRLPGAIVSTLLQLYNIQPNPGDMATGTATVTFVDTQGYTIAAGTVFQLTLPSGSYNFDTIGDVTAASGTQTVSVNLIAEIYAAAPNGTPVGTQLQQVVQTYNIDSIVLTTVLSGGEDPETNQAWLNRAMGRLQGISTTLVTPSDFTQAALDDTADGVFRATSQDLWNPNANSGVGGQAVGWITVSVMGEGGALLSDAAKANLLSILQTESIGGLNVAVEDPTVTTVNVQANVWQEPGYTSAQVQANVAAQLVLPINQGGLGLSTDQWDWSGTLRYNNLISVITQTPGVAFVVQMITPSGDVALSGVAPLASLGSVNILVEGP